MARRFLVCVFLAFATSAAAQRQAGTEPQGKVIAITGTVEHTPARQEQWTPAKMFQPLLAAERVRTLAASRAAVLFIDETQVKLNAGAVLTVQAVRTGTGAPTSLQLERGEGWFRTKNPQSGLTIRTPAAAAAIRGTEVNVSVQADGTTVLTVVEGSVDFSNTAGAVMVNAGEEGTARPGEAPTKRVLLNPDDAVQWALYYPMEAAWRDLPAARLLAAGDVVGARREIDAAIASGAQDIRPLLLLASIELRQNRPDRAAEAAARALAAQPDSAVALVAAAEAAQARFDLQGAERHLDRALRQDPTSVAALVNRARIRFGTGRTNAAKVDAEAAAAAAPDDPQVLSLRGFIRLADGDAAGARTDFESAAGRDFEFGEPHLGLALVHFRQNRANDGLLELLTATLLEPKVSLYQSYLGKAYYQAHRFPEGLSALSTAKRLDPRDPTPWLYTSLFLRDQNQQIDALNELRTAIALNDHRAVYRSRLLLDRDLATKNVSLAEIYRQLGFEAWGAYEALNSIETDYTNASAHLFLAETYGLLPDRTQALGSELLQYFLHAPVNRNSFNNFSEYTSLIEQPRRQLDATVETGTRNRIFGDIAHRSGNERFASVAFVQGSRQEGARPGNYDERYQGFFQGKVSFTSSSDLFVSLSGARSERGQSDDTSRILGLSGDHPVIVRQFVTPDPRISTRIDQVEGTLGYRQQWTAGSSLTAAVRYNYLDHRLSQREMGSTTCGAVPIAPFGLVSTSVTDSPFRGIDLQAQQITRLGRHQLIVGQRYFTQDKEEHCNETIGFPGGDPLFPLESSASGSDNSSVTYVRDEVQVHPRLHVTAGLAYEHMEYADLAANEVEQSSQWSPLVGMSLRLTPRTLLRAGTFRNLNTNVFGSHIGPQTVAGFVFERNELPTAERTEYNVSLEASRSRAFAAFRGFSRDTQVPFLLRRGQFLPEADTRSVGASAFLNLVVTKRLSVFADDQFVHIGADAFDRSDNLLRGGVNFIHPRGLFVRMSVSQVTQRFTDTTVVGLPRSDFALVDLDITYEFAGKHGRLNFNVSNAFDQAFELVLEGLSVDELLPRRRALLTLRWRLF